MDQHILTLCFADLAALAAYIVGHGEYEQKMSTESWAWTSDTNDTLHLTVFHHTDVWVFRQDTWLISFLYTPFIDSEKPTIHELDLPGSRVSFGGQGIAHNRVYQGSKDDIERAMTMFKMVVPPYKDIPRTYGEFAPTEVLP